MLRDKKTILIRHLYIVHEFLRLKSFHFKYLPQDVDMHVQKIRMSNPNEQVAVSPAPKRAPIFLPICAACCAHNFPVLLRGCVQGNWLAWIGISKVVRSFEKKKNSECGKLTALESKTRIHLSLRVHLCLTTRRFSKKKNLAATRLKLFLESGTGVRESVPAA